MMVVHKRSLLSHPYTGAAARLLHQGSVADIVGAHVGP